MKLEQQVCSLDLAKRLKELGVKQDSVFYWTKITSDKEVFMEQYAVCQGNNPENDNEFSAFTVAELGEMLPMGYLSGRSENIETCYVCGKSTGDGPWYREDTEADARAKMLCYLLEN